MKSFIAKPETVEHQWFVVDAADVVLGRLATEVALRLRGKHKPIYTPHVDTGDFIIVVNAEKVRVTGNKMDDKVYHWHTRYPGGLRSKTFKQEITGRFPTRVIEHAVRGMLPKNRLGREMFRKLKVYAGGEHPHAAQQPQELKVGA